MNDFFQMLKKDHEEVKKILGQMSETKDAKKREDLFQKLRKELVPHMKAEEIAFYPVLLEKKDAREDALLGVEEHQVSDTVLNQLEKTPKDVDQWGAKMSVFKELVEHHIKEEESKVFKSAQKTLNNDELQNIMKNFDQEKQKMKETLM